MTDELNLPSTVESHVPGAHTASVKVARAVASILFGLIFPLFIAFGVNVKIDSAARVVESATSRSYVVEEFSRTPSRFKSGNDYALIALADSERANLAVMINKQVMKLVVIYMGFAVMSFAMMFIVLGFNEGPIAASGESGGISLNLKFGSIGAATFVLGAAMAAGGGLLRNDYQTVGLPAFQSAGSASSNLKGKLGEIAGQCASFESEAEQSACMIATIPSNAN